MISEESRAAGQEKEKKMFAPILTDSVHVEEVLKENGIIYEGDTQLHTIGFCKVEAQQECIAGTFCIPKLLDVLGSRYRIMFFITKDKLVLVDDDDFSRRLLNRIGRRKNDQFATK